MLLNHLFAAHLNGRKPTEISGCSSEAKPILIFLREPSGAIQSFRVRPVLREPFLTPRAREIKPGISDSPASV